MNVLFRNRESIVEQRSVAGRNWKVTKRWMMWVRCVPEWGHSVWLHCHWIRSLLQIMLVQSNFYSHKRFKILSWNEFSHVFSSCCAHSKFSSEEDQLQYQRKYEFQKFEDENCRICVKVERLNVLLYVDVWSVFKFPIAKTCTIWSLIAIPNSALEQNRPEWEYLMVGKSYFKSKYAPSCPEYRGHSFAKWHSNANTHNFYFTTINLHLIFIA